MATVTYAPGLSRVAPGGDPNIEPLLQDYVAPYQVLRAVNATKGTNTVAFTMPFRCRVSAFWSRADSNSTGSTVQLLNGDDAITDDLAGWGGADKGVVRAATIDNTYAVVAKDGTLNVTFTENSSDDNTGEAYVLVQALP